MLVWFSFIEIFDTILVVCSTTWYRVNNKRIYAKGVTAVFIKNDVLTLKSNFKLKRLKMSCKKTF